MNTLTINQAMSKRAELRKLYDMKAGNVESIQYNTIMKNRELEGFESNSHEIQNFDLEFSEMISLSEEIDALSTAITKANATTAVGIEDMTIQECLNKVSTYRDRVDIVRIILNRSRESEERKVDASGTTPYYKITRPNYDRQEMKDRLESLSRDIMEMELAIDKVNNDTVINIAW